MIIDLPEPTWREALRGARQAQDQLRRQVNHAAAREDCVHQEFARDKRERIVPLREGTFPSAAAVRRGAGQSVPRPWRVAAAVLQRQSPVAAAAVALGETGP